MGWAWGAVALLCRRVRVHRWLLALLGVGACPWDGAHGESGHLQTHHLPEALRGGGGSPSRDFPTPVLPRPLLQRCPPLPQTNPPAPAST